MNPKTFTFNLKIWSPDGTFQPYCLNCKRTNQQSDQFNVPDQCKSKLEVHSKFIIRKMEEMRWRSRWRRVKEDESQLLNILSIQSSVKTMSWQNITHLNIKYDSLFSTHVILSDIKKWSWMNWEGKHYKGWIFSSKPSMQSYILTYSRLNRENHHLNTALDSQQKGP